MKCFICQEMLVDRSDGDFLCTKCGRIWYDVGDGNYATRMRRVKIKKVPEVGDKYTDIVEVDNEPNA